MALRELLPKAFILALTLNACGPKPTTVGAAQFPTASKLSPTALPQGVTWSGVWFINTAGSRGTMHILMSGEDKFHGCWMAEDKHARATFVGTAKENIAMFDWTQRKVGFVGAPERVSAYLILTPVEDGRHKIKGEYGGDLSSDSGNTWEGIKQKNAEPKEDGCKLEEGDTETTGKPLD